MKARFNCLGCAQFTPTSMTPRREERCAGLSHTCVSKTNNGRNRSFLLAYVAKRVMNSLDFAGWKRHTSTISWKKMDPVIAW